MFRLGQVHLLFEKLLQIQLEQLIKIEFLQPWDHAQKMHLDVGILDFAAQPRSKSVFIILLKQIFFGTPGATRGKISYIG